MPKPRKHEKKNDFIRRCIHDLVHNEGKTSDQALGQCYGVWNEHTKKDLQEVLVGTLFLNFLKNKKETIISQCSKCGHNFNYLNEPEAGMGYVKCPLCGDSVQQPGTKEGG
jgi:DNA-directed RNA polymerase subunit RPC12/RpoP